MCKIFSHVGAATGVLDYGDTFSLLGYGLFGLLLLSGSMIAYAAIRNYHSQTDAQARQTTPLTIEYRTAA
jgi:hypothetical protein